MTRDAVVGGFPEKKKKHRSQKRTRRIGNAAVYLILSVISVVWILPFVYLILQAFRGESTGMVNYILPKEWTLGNFISLFGDTDFPLWFLNTFLVSLVTAAVQTSFVLMVSYALSRMRFRGKRALMNAILILGMFPGFMSRCRRFVECTWARASAAARMIRVASASVNTPSFIMTSFNELPSMYSIT